MNSQRKRQGQERQAGDRQGQSSIQIGGSQRDTYKGGEQAETDKEMVEMVEVGKQTAPREIDLVLVSESLLQ